MIGFSTRLSFAFRCFFSLLFQGKIPQDVLQALGWAKVEVAPLATAAKVTPAAPKVRGDKPSPESLDRAVQMLALLQRDGRLVDFLEEDVSSYPDGQLGAAVRSIHTPAARFWSAISNSSQSSLPRKTSPSPYRWASIRQLSNWSAM
ncbi:MAG: DUF2760 domain-containing protein [Candidatus Sulfotelmatobacter sp.]|jgi:hypothetical protein